MNHTSNPEFQRLLSLHSLASRYNDGLKPKLYEMLIGRRPIQTETVLNLDAPPVSSGPAHHTLTRAELAARGIPCVDPRPAAYPVKDGTDG